MVWGLIVSITVTFLLLYEGYRAGQSRSMGGVGGFILVLLFSWLGLIFIYLSPKDEHEKQEIS